MKSDSDLWGIQVVDRILVIGTVGQLGSELTLALRESYGQDTVYQVLGILRNSTAIGAIRRKGVRNN